MTEEEQAAQAATPSSEVSADAASACAPVALQRGPAGDRGHAGRPRPMLSILAVTAPIYLIMLSYAAVRGGLFAAADMRVMGRLVIYFCLPALLFRTLAQPPLADILNRAYIAAYAAGSLVTLGAFTWLARAVLRRPLPLAAMFGLGAASSNSGFVGYPIAMQLLGPPAGVALALTMLVENLLVIPLALVIADSRKGTARKVLQDSDPRHRRLWCAIVATLPTPRPGVT